MDKQGIPGAEIVTECAKSGLARRPPEGRGRGGRRGRGSLREVRN